MQSNKASKGEKPNDKLLVVATVSTVFGVKGWVKVISHTQPPENAFKYKPWKIKASASANKSETSHSKALTEDRNWQELTVAEYKQHAKGLVARFEGCSDRDVARQYTGLDIYVDQDLMPMLESDEHYWHDLEGLKVFNLNGSLFGVVDYLFETGSNDVLVVKACAGSLDKKERLIPYIVDQVVKEVDTTRGEMRVDWEEDF